MSDFAPDKTLSIFSGSSLAIAGSISILPASLSVMAPETLTASSPGFLDNTLPMAVAAASGTDVSLTTILDNSLGANFGGYNEFWIAYYGAATLSSWDFSYWNLSHPAVAKWLVNGHDIGPDFSNQTFITAAQVGTVSLQAGNDIGDLAYVMVPIAFDGSGNPIEYDQFSIITVDPSLIAPDAGDGAPTPADIVASAERFAADYSGVPNDNDCHKIACAVAAAAGAAFDDDMTYSLDPTQNESGGFWRVAYRGSQSHPVADWQTLVRPGDIVRMGWQGGGQHTTTVLSVNANGTIQVFDNDDFTNANVEIIGIHTANYDTDTIASTITIYRLASDHLYLISGTSTGEALSGTAFNDEIVGYAGNDILSGGVGNDVLNGGSGNDILIGGPGADKMTGGAGKDTFRYSGVSDSTGTGHDTITDFDASLDRFALTVAVTGIDATVTSGMLRSGHLDHDLAVAIGTAHLAADHAVLFTPTSGNLAGETFLVVDANGHAGYQADADYVVALTSPANIGDLSTHNFALST